MLSFIRFPNSNLAYNHAYDVIINVVIVIVICFPKIVLHCHVYISEYTSMKVWENPSLKPCNVIPFYSITHYKLFFWRKKQNFIEWIKSLLHPKNTQNKRRTSPPPNIIQTLRSQMVSRQVCLSFCVVKGTMTSIFVQ